MIKINEFKDFLTVLIFSENKYIYEDRCRSNLLNNLIYLKRIYEKVKDTEKNNYTKVCLLLLLERIKQTILFENALIECIHTESNIFVDNISQLIHDKIFVNTYKEVRRTNKNTKRSNYPQKVTYILRKWLEENIDHPYPTNENKEYLCDKTGLDVAQINNWFINARRRILPTMRQNKNKYGK